MGGGQKHFEVHVRKKLGCLEETFGRDMVNIGRILMAILMKSQMEMRHMLLETGRNTIHVIK